MGFGIFYVVAFGTEFRIDFPSLEKTASLEILD
jgi:hypothetical protein